MDLKEFLKLDRDKIKLSVTIITMSILLGIFGIYFTRFHSLDFVWIFPGLFLIIIYFFYLPVILSMDLLYIFRPRPDMDTWTAAQFSFHFSLMFLLSCFYVYFISCIVLFFHRMRRANDQKK